MALAAAIVTQSKFWADNQVQKPASTAPAFETASFKHTGNMWDGGRIEGDRQYPRLMRSLEYEGVRLSGEVPLSEIFGFAYSPLLKPWSWEFNQPNWMAQEYFEIEAIAPDGTTLDGARVMLQTVLVERLGFKCHLTDRDTPMYALLRGTGELKLAPAAEPEPNPSAMQMGAFKKKSASLADFAGFLGSLMDREVVDKAGLPGQYKFDVDWSTDIVDTMREFGRHGDPTIVLTGLKRLGLKLEPSKEPQKVMVVDHWPDRPLGVVRGQR